MTLPLANLAILAPQSTFDALAAAALWDADPNHPTVADSLADLVAAGHLTRQPNPLYTGDGRYGESQLTATRYALAAPLAPVDDPALALRHATHYEGLHRGANYRQFQEKPAPDYGRRLLQLEWPNIAPAQQWAASQPGDPAADALCDDFAAYGYPLLPTVLTPAEYSAWLNAALASAVRLHRTRSQLFHLLNLGELALDAHTADDAWSHFQRALALAESLTDKEAQAEAEQGLGLAAHLGGDLDTAHTHYSAALALARQINDPEGVAALQDLINQL